MHDPAIGYRLKPNARARFTTAEFDTEIAINAAGRPRRRADRAQTAERAAHRAPRRLAGAVGAGAVQPDVRRAARARVSTRARSADPLPRDQRRRPGLRPGRGAALLPLHRRARSSRTSSSTRCSSATTPRRRCGRRRGCSATRVRRPSAVAESLTTRLRRRRPPQHGAAAAAPARRVGDRAVQRRAGPPEPPLQSYAAQSGAAHRARASTITRECVQAIARLTAAAAARARPIALMPARFQVDDADYGRLKEAVARRGRSAGARRRDERFDAALAPLGCRDSTCCRRCARRCPGPTCSSRRRCT